MRYIFFLIIGLSHVPRFIFVVPNQQSWLEYIPVWLIDSGRQDQTKRARDNEQTRGILSVSTKWTSVNEAVTCSLTQGVKAWDNSNDMSGGMSYPVNSRKLAAGDSCVKIDAARD